jgi:glycosyltransferase involved in cell wall biosynthesis
MSQALQPYAIGPAGREPEAESRSVELTILMPCLNEAETIDTCIAKACEFLARSGVAGEILIADNGSTDGSVEFALARGARTGRRCVPADPFGWGFYRSRAMNSLRGLEPARRVAFRLLHVSTDEVHGTLGPEGLFTERYAPNSPYSANKASLPGPNLVTGRFVDETGRSINGRLLLLNGIIIT